YLAPLFEKLQEQIQDQYEQLLRESWNDPGLEMEAAHVFASLGIIFSELGQVTKADHACGRSMAILKGLVEKHPNHPHDADEGSLLLKLSDAFEAAGQLDKTLSLREELHAKRKDKLGPDHWRTMHCMRFLAWAYVDAGQFDKALRLKEE